MAVLMSRSGLVARGDPRSELIRVAAVAGLVLGGSATAWCGGSRSRLSGGHGFGDAAMMLSDAASTERAGVAVGPSVRIAYWLICRRTLPWVTPTSFRAAVNGNFRDNGAETMALEVVPLPAALWLFGSAFLGLCWLGRRSATSGVGTLPR